MRYFPILDFKYAVLAIFLGMVSVILVYITWAAYAARREKEASERPAREVQDLVQTREVEDNPVVPLLIVIYVGVIIWVVAYLILVGMEGGPF